MEIQKLTEEWVCFTDEVIRFENPGYKEIRNLFRKTLETIESYRKEKLVPKELTGLLLEMHEFGWWVSDLIDTPLYTYYQEIVSVAHAINKYFLTNDTNVESIVETIGKIGE